MAEAQHIVTALKRQLKARSLRYADLARAIGVSEVSVKRMLSSGRMTLARLETICAVLEIDFFELARGSRRAAELSTRELSQAQEDALAAAPRLMVLFHLLCQDWTPAEIRREYKLSEPELARLLARLVRMRLIELGARNAVRMRVPRDPSWRRNGPVWRRYARVAVTEYLRGSFDGPGALLRLEVKELGEASLAVLRRRLERLAAEFVETAAADASLPPSKRRSVGMVLALKPWVFSIVDALRSQTSGPEVPVRPSPKNSRRLGTVNGSEDSP